MACASSSYWSNMYSSRGCGCNNGIDVLITQEHKLKGKDKLQEEIDAFEEAPKALVKWVPKTTSSSTSSSSTTTPRIPIKMVWIPKKKN